MKEYGRLGTVLMAVAFTTGVGYGADNKLADDAAKILAKAEKIELYSLDPSRIRDKDKLKDDFHGFGILGKTTLKGDAKKDLVSAFQKGLAGQIDPAACFNPRHGIRATYDSKTVDLVICFECAQFMVYGDKDDKGKSLLVNKKPQTAFDKALKDAGLEKAK